MKKYFFLIILLLFIIVAFIYYKNFGSDNNFAISNIEDVTRIELSDKDNQVILTKAAEGQWFISSFKANMRNISNLKKIISALEVKYPLPKMYDSVYSINNILNNGLAVKIFQNKNILKNYHLLFSDSIGAIGLIDGKKKSYVLELQGYNIDLNDYFSVKQVFWENNILFTLDSKQIKSIQVEHTDNPNNSFIIEKNNDSISLFDKNKDTVKFNTSKMAQYLSYFRNVSFENNLNISDEEKQKILSIKPLYMLTIESVNETLTYLIIPIENNQLDDYGNPLVYDRDFFNIVVPQKELFARVKWLEFDILLEDLSYFYR
jgi:hypothetical protein